MNVNVYVIAYDIADDDRREAVSVALSGFGARVQLSVFECELADAAEMTALRSHVEALIDVDEDQVRIYPLTARTLRDITILGNRRLQERHDFWIV